MAARQQVEHLDGVPAELLPPGGVARLRPVPRRRGARRACQSAARAAARSWPSEVAATGVYFVPTLAAFERISEMRLGRSNRCCPNRTRPMSRPGSSISGGASEWPHSGSDSHLTIPRAMAAVRRGIVEAFNDAGVPMMAGSDTPHPFHVWGFGLIREVEALASAGLGPMGALRSATVVPRDYLRSLPQSWLCAWDGQPTSAPSSPAPAPICCCSIEDPSSDISALRSIRAVVAGGRVYERAALEAMLADARKSGKAQPKPGSHASTACVPGRRGGIDRVEGK